MRAIHRLALHCSAIKAPGYAQQEIAKEKNARAETNYSVAEAQVTGHLKSRGADVHAVQKRNDIKQEEERKQPPRNSFSCALCDL